MCAVYCIQRFLSFGASTVYTCSMVSVAEQDDGVLECNRSARRVCEMPSTLRFTQMQCRKCCDNIVLTCTSNDIDRLPASWSIYCGDEKQ